MNKPVILIADHNPFVRKSVKEFLDDREIQVREALSGSEMLKMARDFSPDVIIMGKDLPGPGGRSAFKALKGEDGLRHIPVILFKEKIIAKDRVETINGNDAVSTEQEKAFDVIEKPFNGEELDKILDNALEYASGERLRNAGKKKEATKENKEDRYQPLIGGVAAVDQRLKEAAEFDEFTDHDFNRFQDFLMKKVGLFFDIKRKTDLAKALRNRMIALDLYNYLDYFQYLNHSQNEEKELRNLVLYLTIGETTFFRSPDQFKALREYILPRLLSEKRKKHKLSLKIWSAGCSTGEEPYSIAITLREIIPDIDNWNIEIYASDINQKFLKFAKEGLYHPRKIRFVNEEILSRYFIKENAHYRISPKISDMVSFGFHNLSVDTSDLYRNSDVVFCRNVLIYFRRDRIKAVIDKFHSALKDDGYLILGYSETLFQISSAFNSIHYGDAFFYAKSTEEKEDAFELLEAKSEPFKWPYENKSATSEQPGSLAPPTGFEPTNQPEKEKAPYLPWPPETVEAGTEPEAEKIEKDERAVPLKEIVSQPVHDQIEEKTDFDIEKRGSQVETMWEDGLNHYFYERFEDAENVFKKLAEKWPDSARAQLGLGFIYANKGKDSMAVDKIEKSMEMNNLLPEAYYLRALIKEKNGEVEAAMADYRNVILLDPDFAMAHFNLGILFMKQNRIRDSRREFRNTLNILKSFKKDMGIKFSGGLHREALIQLCGELSE